MKNLYWILFFLFALLFVLNRLKKSGTDPFESNINVEIIKALQDTANSKLNYGDNNSFIKVLEDGSILSEKHIQEQMVRHILAMKL